MTLAAKRRPYSHGRKPRPHVQTFGQARAHRRNRAIQRLQAWLERNPEASQRWEELAVTKAGLLARGRLAEAQALVRNPRGLRKYILTR